MLVDSNDFGPSRIQRLRMIARELIPEIDVMKYYNDNQQFIKRLNINESQMMTNHIQNWLFTIKCETDTSGIRYIEIVLRSLQKTLKRDIDDLQYDYVKALISIFLSEYKKYK